MKKKKYLPLYYKWIKTGAIDKNGLCNVFGEWNAVQRKWEYHDKLFKLMIPTFYTNSTDYWAADDDYGKIFGFGPTRQNILLLLAAMNGEL